MTFDHGNIAFSGIATGAFGAIIVYQVMKVLSANFAFRDGGLPFMVPLATLAQAGDSEADLATATFAGEPLAEEPQLAPRGNGKPDAPTAVKPRLTNGAPGKKDTPDDGAPGKPDRPPAHTT